MGNQKCVSEPLPVLDKVRAETESRGLEILLAIVCQLSLIKKKLENCNFLLIFLAVFYFDRALAPEGLEITQHPVDCEESPVPEAMACRDCCSRLRELLCAVIRSLFFRP